MKDKKIMLQHIYEYKELGDDFLRVSNDKIIA